MTSLAKICPPHPKIFFQVLTRRLDVTHKKTAPPRQKIFFRVQSTRLADPFESLNSSLAQIGGGARALVRQPKIAVFLGRNPSTNIP